MLGVGLSTTFAPSTCCRRTGFRSTLRAVLNAMLLEESVLELSQNRRMLLEVCTSVVSSLTDAFSVERIPSPALLDEARICSHVENLTRATDALAIKDVELHLAERWSHLILYHLHPSAVSDDRRFLASLRRRGFFDRANSPHVEAHRGVELERVTAGRGLGAAEHNPDFHADLVGKEDDAVRS